MENQKSRNLEEKKMTTILEKLVNDITDVVIPVEWIEKYLDKWCDKPELDKFRNFTEEMIETWRRENGKEA